MIVCSLVYYIVIVCSLVYYIVIVCSLVYYIVIVCSLVYYIVIVCSLVYYIVILCFLVLLHYDTLIISCGIFSLFACGLHIFVRERTYVDGRYHSRTFMSDTNIGTTCLQL